MSLVNNAESEKFNKDLNKFGLLDKWHTVFTASSDAKLKPVDAIILMQLIERSTGIPAKTFIGAEAISKNTGANKRTVLAGLERLEAAGYCSKTGKKKSRSFERLIHLQKHEGKNKEHSEFWAAYPKRSNVADAEEMLTQIQNLTPVEYHDVLAGARRYAIACEGRESKYIQRPDIWLAKKRWLDDFDSPEPKQPKKQNTKKEKPTSSQPNESKARDLWIDRIRPELIDIFGNEARLKRDTIRTLVSACQKTHE